MSRGVDLSGLSTLTDDATLTALSVILETEHNTHRSTRRSLINNLLTGLRDAESMYAGSGEPTDKPQGKIFFDTNASPTVWKGYRTANGTPVTLLDTATAYQQALSTGGTATHKTGGRLTSVTTQVSLGAVTSGTLMTYTVSGATFGATGEVLIAEAFGTKTGTTAAFSLQWRYATTGIGTAVNFTGTAAYDWHMYLCLIRTGAATADAGFYAIASSDATGSTTLCDFATPTPTFASDFALDIQCTTKNAGDTVTMETMVVYRWG